MVGAGEVSKRCCARVQSARRLRAATAACCCSGLGLLGWAGAQRGRCAGRNGAADDIHIALVDGLAVKFFRSPHCFRRTNWRSSPVRLLGPWIGKLLAAMTYH